MERAAFREKEFNIKTRARKASDRQNERRDTAGSIRDIIRPGAPPQSVDGRLRYDPGRGDRRIRRATVKEFGFSERDLDEIAQAGKYQIIDDSVVEINDPALFAELISASKINNKWSASVYVYEADEYANMRLFTTKDGLAGIALKPDGEIVSLYSHGEGKNRAMQLMQVAINEGGLRCDCFNTILPIAYSKMRFKPIARTKWNNEYAPQDWDKETYNKYQEGEPDVVFMAYTGERISPEDVKRSIKAIPYSDTYNKAAAIQNFNRTCEELNLLCYMQ